MNDRPPHEIIVKLAQPVEFIEQPALKAPCKGPTHRRVFSAADLPPGATLAPAPPDSEPQLRTLMLDPAHQPTPTPCKGSTRRPRFT
jgi:hypothetical protein